MRHSSSSSVCRDWFRYGTCPRGTSCRFSHTLPQELDQQLMAEGRQPAEKRMSSEERELSYKRKTSSSSYTICRDWERQGTCTNGSSCRYSHPSLQKSMAADDHLQSSNSVKPLEEREPSSKKQVKICWEWERFHRCSRAAKCTYLHPSPTSLSKISVAEIPSPSFSINPSTFSPKISQEITGSQPQTQLDGKMSSEASKNPAANVNFTPEGSKSCNQRERATKERSGWHKSPSDRPKEREEETKEESHRDKSPSDRPMVRGPSMPINGQMYMEPQMTANVGSLDKKKLVPQDISNLKSANGNMLAEKNMQQMEGEPTRRSVVNLPYTRGKGEEFKGNKTTSPTEIGQQTNQEAGDPFSEHLQMSESALETMRAEAECSEIVWRQLQEGIMKRLRAVKDLEMNLKKVSETLKKERIEVNAALQHSSWMLEEASRKEANALAKIAEVYLLKSEAEKAIAEISIQLAVCQRKERELKVEEKSLRIKEKNFAERLQAFEAKEKQLDEGESKIQQLLNRRRKQTQPGPPDHQHLEAHNLKGVSVKLEPPDMEEERSHKQREVAPSSPHVDVAKETNNESRIMNTPRQTQEVPDTTSLLDGKVTLEPDVEPLIAENHATILNRSEYVLALGVEKVPVRNPRSKDKTKPGTKTGMAQKSKQNLGKSVHGNGPRVEEVMGSSDAVKKVTLESDSCQQNPEADSGRRRKKRGKKVGKKKSMEEVLRHDAPELLASLQEKGLLEVFESIDRMSLEDEEGTSEDNERKSACPGEFADLQGVLLRLFGSVQDGGRNSGGNSSSSVGQNDGLLLSGGNRQRYCIENLAAILDQCTAVKRYGWPASWGWSRKCKCFVFVFDRHNRIVLEWPEYPNATYFFEVEAGIDVIWQVKRLLAVMASAYVRKNALLENKCLEMEGKVVTEQEALLLQCYGWTSDSGLGSLLNYRDRLFHDYRTADDAEAFQVAIAEWRAKVGKKLQDGISEGRRTREPPEAYRLWEKRQLKEPKAEP